MLMLMVGLVAGTALFLTVQESSQGDRERYASDYEKLQAAKKALIAYASFQNQPEIEEDTVPPTYNSPGELPCPDRNYDGRYSAFGDGSASRCLTYAGWLPHITLDIDEIRDSSGSRIWYAVSDNYQTQKNEVLNSTTAGTLMLDGNEVVAVLIAPGEPINAAQESRNTIGGNEFADNVVDYFLDFSNADGDPTESDQLNNPDAIRASSYFTQENNAGSNDIVIGITAAELWQHAATWPMQHARAKLLEFHDDDQHLPFAKDSNGDCTDDGFALLQGLIPVADEGGDCGDDEGIAVEEWFTYNEWDQVIFYAVSALCAGADQDDVCDVPDVGDLYYEDRIDDADDTHAALLIHAGAIMQQETECHSRPPYSQVDPRLPLPAGIICDYLELDENTDADNNFVRPGSNQVSNDYFLTIDI